MRTARITSRQAREALAVATDPDLCAVRGEEDARTEREEIDQLIEDVDRELEAEARTARSRVLRPFADVERARRSQRRRERKALRGLPSRWSEAA